MSEQDLSKLQADMLDKIELAGEPSPSSLSEIALNEVGRKLFLESTDILRDFCKSMLTISAAAIPTYIALLQVGSGNAKGIPGDSNLLFAVPAVLFLLAILSFCIGLVPQRYEKRLEILEDVKEMREALMRYRYIWSLVGISVFSFGIIVGIYTIIFRIP